jgi:pimeloyl-ACP methyl ester carboxylesterase
MDFQDPAPYVMAAAPAASPSSSLTAAADSPGGLRRRGDWGFRLIVNPSARAAEVRRLEAGSAAERAGLREGDQVVRIGATPVTDSRSVMAARHRLRGGDRVELEVQRDGRSSSIAFVLPTLALESIPGCRVEYGSVVSPRGHRVRTVVARPEQARGKLPALLFIPWLSCDAVEAPGDPDGWMQLLRGLSQRGWVVMRVEKPGIGDSDGPDCFSNDLEIDLDAYRAAIRELRGLDGVDPSRIVLFGGSIGGALAPLLAVEQPVAGLIASGTFSRTWYEHMLEFERQRLTLAGRPPAEINRAMAGFAELYALYLGQRLTPGEVVAKRPDLAPLWSDSPDGQYGRPAAYYHQVARVNVEEAWAKLDVPVLILHGEYDWMMSPAEHEHIRDLVNARRPESATLVTLPRTDHNLDVYPSQEDAFAGRNGRFEPDLIGRVATWLDATFAKGTP